MDLVDRNFNKRVIKSNYKYQNSTKNKKKFDKYQEDSKQHRIRHPCPYQMTRISHNFLRPFIIPVNSSSGPTNHSCKTKE